jgi:mono/diheme cytochrome c family protein
MNHDKVGCRVRAKALLFMALAAMTTGCERADKSAEINEGAALFAANCAACHGPQGDVREAEMYDRDTPDLRRIAQNSPGGRLPRVILGEIIDGRRLIEGHTRSMPAWGEALGQGDDTVAEAKIDSLVAYIESIQQR